jgi:hypothetical protein
MGSFCRRSLVLSLCHKITGNYESSTTIEIHFEARYLLDLVEKVRENEKKQQRL